MVEPAVGLLLIGVAPIENQEKLKEIMAPFTNALISGDIFSNQSMISGNLLVPLYPTCSSFLDFTTKAFIISMSLLALVLESVNFPELPFKKPTF